MSHYLHDVLWTGRDELKQTHYEISPREREDEARRFEREFGTEELAAEDMDDRVRRSQEGPPDES